MCGLIFIRKTEGFPARDHVWKKYGKQKDRGTRGYGYISIANGVISNIEREKYEVDIEKKIHAENASAILFHHRTPTSTENMVEATHPIEVKHPTLQYDYYLAHNGVIGNDTELRPKHEKDGYLYSTLIRYKTITRLGKYSAEEFNDSEALAIEMAMVLDGKKEKVEAEGSIAFICLQVEKETRKVKAVYFGRNYGNPLVMNSDTSFISLTSEGGGTEVKPNTLYRMDWDTAEITESNMYLRSFYSGGGGGFLRDYDDEYDYSRSQEWYSSGDGPKQVGLLLPKHEEEIQIDPDREKAEKLYREWYDVEEEIDGLTRDIEVLNERKMYLIEQGDEKGEDEIEKQIDDKRREKASLEVKSQKILVESGVYEQ